MLFNFYRIKIISKYFPLKYECLSTLRINDKYIHIPHGFAILSSFSIPHALLNVTVLKFVPDRSFNSYAYWNKTVIGPGMWPSGLENSPCICETLGSISSTTQMTTKKTAFHLHHWKLDVAVCRQPAPFYSQWAHLSPRTAAWAGLGFSSRVPALCAGFVPSTRKYRKIKLLVSWSQELNLA